jgi:O-acetyl-ADP-ribose deacetylase (regulator of RNase III)
MIKVVNQSLFTLDVDAIVNSANVSLLAGSGICGVIHKNAGNELEDYCKTIGKQEYGSAVISPSFKLSPICEYIIHACGPRYLDGKRGEAELLALTHQSIIEVAIENSLKSIVIPPISTGVYRFPIKKAAQISIETVANALNASNYDMDVFVAMKDANKYKIYHEALIKHQFVENYKNRLPAELLEPYFETLFICDQHPGSPLQFGRFSQYWQDIFATESINSLGVITAYNPFSKQNDNANNVKYQERLFKRLKQDGFELFNGVGMSQDGQWQEPSFFVFDMDEAKLIEYLVSFEQTGGLWMDSEALPKLVLHPSVIVE